MHAKSLFVFALAGTSLAAPQIDFLDLAKSLTSEYATMRPTGTAAAEISSHLSEARSLISEFSGMPTLPTSVFAVLSTLIADDDEAAFCQPTAASWYKSLDRSAQVAVTSYASAIQTWAAGKAKSGGDGFFQAPACSALTTSLGTSSRTSSHTSSHSSSVSTRVVGGFTSAATPTVSSTSAPGAAAPKSTGAIVGSIAGVMGVIGVIAVL